MRKINVEIENNKTIQIMIDNFSKQNIFTVISNKLDELNINWDWFIFTQNGIKVILYT